jgi:hypothetical protein
MNPPGPKAYRSWTLELYAEQGPLPRHPTPGGDLVFFLIDVVPTLDLSRIQKSGVGRLCRLAAPGMMKMELGFGSQPCVDWGMYNRCI